MAVNQNKNINFTCMTSSGGINASGQEHLIILQIYIYEQQGKNIHVFIYLGHAKCE